MVSIVIVDSHSFFRMGLITLLNKSSQFNVLAEFTSLSDNVIKLVSLQPDFLTVEYPFPGATGWESIAAIKKNCSAVKIIFFSSSKDEYYISRAVEEGVDGILYKECEPQEFLLGINKISAGQRYYSNEISNILLNSAYTKQYKGMPFLTTKEKEIIRLLMEGFSSKQIAARLDVSPRTIDTHRANILGKFKLKNTTELISRIAEQKIRL